MNCRIDDATLRQICREVLIATPNSTVRGLRAELHRRVGATGKTARLLRVWAEERSRLSASLPKRLEAAEITGCEPELIDRVRVAEQKTAEMKARAELAELREVAHQDRWAMEIDRLREQLRNGPAYAREILQLQATVARLTAENAALRNALQAP